MYDPKKHVAKEWQMIGCGVFTVVATTGAFFAPIKPGEIPVVRLAAFAVAALALTAGASIEKSKEPLDRQKAVIDAANKKVFANSQAIDAALLLEVKRAKSEEVVVKECDRN
jgi:hypothetical protein